MKISLCMIVKNEESQIIPCLERAMEFVDEAIIIDTGSTDQTKALIQESFCDDSRVILHDYIWENDFGKARNESLKYATGDWILVMDADERIFADRSQLEAYVESREDKAYIVMIYNILDPETIYKTPTMVRFFKRQGATYQGAIHEQVCYDGSSIYANRIPEEICRIYHYGYTVGVFNEKNKQKRNVDILKEEIKENPYNPFNWYNMGVMEMMQQSYHSAIDAFLKSHKLCKGVRYVFHEDLILRIAISMIALKQYKQIINFVDTVTDDPILKRKPDLYYYQGVAFGHLKKYSKAYESLSKSIAIGEYTKGASKMGVGSFLPKLLWAELLVKQRKTDAAIEKFWDAVFDENNVNHMGQDALRTLLVKCDKEAEIAKLEQMLTTNLRDEIENNRVELLEHMKAIKENISAMIDNNDIENAQKTLQEYEALMPDDIDIYSIKGVMAIVLGKAREAETVFLKGLDKEPENYDLLFNLGVLYTNLEQEEDAQYYYKKAYSVAPSNEDRTLLADMIKS